MASNDNEAVGDTSALRTKGIVGKTTVGSLPKGAVRISESQIWLAQTQLVKTWKPQYEMLPFKYGPEFLTTCCATGGLVMASHYSRMFNITRYRLLVNLAVALPTAMSCGFLHKTTVYNRMRAEYFNCAVCYSLKSAVIQCATGALLPACASLCVCSSIATATYSYAVPYPAVDAPLLQFVGRLVRFLGQHLRMAAKPIAVLCVAQLLIGDVVCWAELQNFQMLNRRFIENYNNAIE